QERAGVAKLLRVTEALGRDGGDTLLGGHFLADALVLRVRRNVRAQPVGVEGPRQYEVDRDVGARDRAGDTGQEGGETGARPGRQVQSHERRLHRARGDVDDPA